MLDALGNIGDLLGGIGVIVTLLYLASQIHQNTHSVRASAFQAAQRDMSDKLDSLASDPELIRIYFAGNKGFETLSSDDRRRYASFMSGMLRRYETLIYQTRVGNIDPQEWAGLREELRHTFSLPGTRAWWALAHGSFNQDLQEFIAHEIIAERPCDPAV